MPRSEMSKVAVLLLLTVHGSIAAVLQHGLDPLTVSNDASLLDTFHPLSNDGSSADNNNNNNNNIMAASVGEKIPDDAGTTGQLLAEQAIQDPFSINEGEMPQPFILSDTSNQCGKTPNSQAQPSDSNKRVRRRETGEYCRLDDGLDRSSPGSTQGPTANPPDEGSTRQEAGSLIQKSPSGIIPSAAKGPTVNPFLCPVVGRMIPVCHGMYEPVLGLGPFELEHCSPSM